MTGAGISAALLAAIVAAPPADSVPEWLDTSAPVVKVEPRSRHQRTLFHITLSANETARIRVSKAPAGAFEEYSGPLTVSEEGATVLRYYAEDDFGNRSAIDSVVFVLDTRAPRLSYRPPSTTVVRLSAGEPCRFFVLASAHDTEGVETAESLVVRDSFEGYIAAVDRAGNRTVSGRLSYTIDSVAVELRMEPEPGMYNEPQTLVLRADPPTARIFYTFDPLAPFSWFRPYDEPVPLPHGLSVVRCFAQDSSGWKTDVGKATFVVDTVPPTIRMRRAEGSDVDTLYLSTREPAAIYYAVGNRSPSDDGPVCDRFVLVPRRAVGILRAIAVDSAGNRSELLEWRHRYDTAPPVVRMSPRGGLYAQPPVVRLSADKPARFFFTLDGSEPSVKSTLYAEPGIAITKPRRTVLRCIGVDEAENLSAELTDTFFIDTRPPVVKARIEGAIEQNRFWVTLVADEPARIHYEIGAAAPTRSSPRYHDRIALRLGQALSYFAVDSAGNRSEMKRMDELRKPMVTASPQPGGYNRRVRVAFVTSMPSRVHWRILPDTVFAPYIDSLVLDKEGQYTLEYYSQTEAGVRSPTHRQEYTIDLTPPRVGVSVRKGLGDTAFILFEASERASIYYTLDGSNPLFSSTTRMAGNKFTRSSDRIMVRRGADVKLAFYAEDIVGNQSAMSVLDLFRPRPVPSVPDGAERVYDRVLSLSFSTFDQAQIYYSRHGGTPTIDSAVFREPLTLVKSDTIRAFAVDASGFVGDTVTFIYLIDLPPSPDVVISPPPDSLSVGKEAVFDGSGSVDNESALTALAFRWDFDGDGTFDTQFEGNPVGRHVYATSGLYYPTMEVRDEAKRTASLSTKVLVTEPCPAGMVFAVDSDGHRFCIDRYEWPNIKGKRPLSGVSWVEAKMFCIDVGKRLCTADEWKSACRGFTPHAYPYGPGYEEGRCATEGKDLHGSGAFDACGEGFGLADMIGNAWEWVNDKRGDYPRLAGGSYRQRADAHCGLLSVGTVASTAEDIGFRCCK
jgi:hypothetical protein